MREFEDGSLTGELGGGDRERVLQFRNLRPGALFASRYRILETLGHGGAGEVYRARDEIAQSDVALKVLFPGTGEAAAERLRRELQIVRGLSHPGLLRSFDIGRCDGLLYMVSELLTGESLKQRLARGPLDPAEAERVLRGMLEGLAAAHAAGVIHRDIKPANVFLHDGPPERVVLLDFGLAREAGSAGLTTTGRFLGTPEYTSPEQLRGDREITASTDLYSCGVCAREMLFGADGGGSAARAVSRRRWREDSARNGKSPPPRRLLHLTMRLLEPDPAHRPATAEQGLALLEQHRPLSYLATRLRYAARRAGVWRRRAVVAVGLLGLFALAGWIATPVAVDSAGGVLSWSNAIGMRWSRDLTPLDVQAAALETAGFGPFRATWVVAGDSSPAGARTQLAEATQRLVRIPSPFTQARVIRSRPAIAPAAATYPLYRGDIRASLLLPLEGLRRPGESLLAQISQVRPGMTTWIEQLVGWNGGTVATLHPGLVRDLHAVRSSADGDLLLVGTGFNNLLGPRSVLFASPAGAAAIGQHPPFAASLASWPPAAGWYTPLRYSGTRSSLTLRVDARVIRVQQPGRAPQRFETRTGVPLDDGSREGLEVEAWRRARERWRLALLSAARSEASGRPRQGAEELESFGHGNEAPAVLRSTALFRAAQLRLAVAAGDGAAELEQGLADVDGAASIEPEPPRYHLLRAELLYRLGRRDELAGELRGLRSRLIDRMYLLEWRLVDLLAGEPLGEEAFGELLPLRDDLLPWPVLLRLVDGTLDPERLDRFVASRLGSLNWSGRWDLLEYWAARRLLEQPQPDRARALESLEHAASGSRLGYTVPVELLRQRALAEQDPSLVTAQGLRAAEQDFSRLERAAATELHALFLLPLAREDLARVGQAAASAPAALSGG